MLTIRGWLRRLSRRRMQQRGSPAPCHAVSTYPGPLRRLPFVCAPQAGESFASWMDRTATALGVPPGVLADGLHLPVRRHHTDAVPVLYGALLAPSARDAVSYATGLPAGAVDALQLSAYHGTALDLDGLDPHDERTLQSVGRRQWALFHGSRACPECLTETGGVWQLAWKLSIAAVCHHHGRLLLDSCPTCDAPLRAGARGGPRPLSRVYPAQPAGCGAVRGRFRCTTKLDTAAVGTAVPLWLTTLQREVIRTAEGATPRLGGRAVSPAEFFTTLRSLAALVRFAASPSSLQAELPAVIHDRYAAYLAVDRSRGGGADGYRARPADAAAAAGLLAALAPALTARTNRQLHHALRALASAASRRRLELGRDPLRTVVLPAVLRAALAPPLPHARVARGALAAADDKLHLEPRSVPELIAPGDYSELLAELLPGTFELTGRRFAALAVARLAGATTWAQAGAITGCDPVRARQVADVVTRRVTDPTAFWQAARIVAARLQRDCVDYARRRSVLGHLTRVPESALPAAARRAGAPWTEQRRRHAATWLWAEITGGDWRDAPAQRDPAWAATAESRREGFRRFRAGAPPTLQAALRGHGLALCEEAS